MRNRDIAFEDALHENWSGDPDLLEVPLDRKPIAWAGALIALAGLVAVGTLGYLSLFKSSVYRARAERNASPEEYIPAPRGIIKDRFGKPIAENRAAFRAVFLPGEFIKGNDVAREKMIQAAEEFLGVSKDEVLEEVARAGEEERFDPLVLRSGISQEAAVALKSLQVPSLRIEEGFERL